jgi:hypothetical protein
MPTPSGCVTFDSDLLPLPSAPHIHHVFTPATSASLLPPLPHPARGAEALRAAIRRDVLLVADPRKSLPSCSALGAHIAQLTVRVVRRGGHRCGTRDSRAEQLTFVRGERR